MRVLCRMPGEKKEESFSLACIEPPALDLTVCCHTLSVTPPPLSLSLFPCYPRPKRTIRVPYTLLSVRWPPEWTRPIQMLEGLCWPMRVVHLVVIILAVDQFTRRLQMRCGVHG
jgi:hypothetical protein